jgi:hypothetical protein
MLPVVILECKKVHDVLRVSILQLKLTSMCASVMPFRNQQQHDFHFVTLESHIHNSTAVYRCFVLSRRKMQSEISGHNPNRK